MKSTVHLLKSSNMIKVNWKNCLNILDNSVCLLDHQCRIYSLNISFVALQLLTVEDFATIARKEFHLLHLGMSCDQFCARTPHVAHRTFNLNLLQQALCTHVCVKSACATCLKSYLNSLWQYGLSNFQGRDSKLCRFLAKNQHTPRKFLFCE